MNPKSKEKSHSERGKLSLEPLDGKLKITADIDSNTYGILGSCLSQDTACINSLTSEFLKEYPQNTVEHEYGKRSIDVVVSALQAIPECSIEQTPHWSSADIKWKWDLILKYNEYYFPIQVKSSLKSIDKCRSTFYKTIRESTRGDRDQYRKKLDKLSARLRTLTPKTSQYATLLNEKIRIRELYRKEVEISSKAFSSQILKEPLYIWVSWDTDGVLNILSAFCSLFNVDITDNIRDSAISYYDRIRSVK